MADIQCVFESMTNKGSIYISNFKAAQNLTLLHQRGIKAIVSMARSGFVQHSKQDIPYYLYIPAEDHQQYEIYKHFNKTYDFIDQARKQTNVLVHCMVGVSRSVTIVMAYLLKKYKTSLSDVITILQRKRRKINPNKGFIEQLKKYAQQQGLKCDFQGVSVPAIRERPQSAHKRKASIEKQLKENQNAHMNNPFTGKNQDADKLDYFTGKIVKINSHQNERIRNIARSEKNNQKSTDNLKNLDKLDKKEIFSHKKSPEKRQVSIEQKINKVRQKLKKQQVQLTKSKSSLQKRMSNQKNVQNYEPNQQKTGLYENIKPKKIEDYLKFYTINIQMTDLAINNRAQNDKKFNRNHSEQDIFNNQKLTEQAIYQKIKIIKPRKAFGKGIH